MCGFAGFLGTSIIAGRSHARALRDMGNALVHRGPDDSGMWLDVSAGLGVIHRRLAVLDLSQAGHQPMESFSGRYVIAFNGEIYNHKELRQCLEKNGNYSWRGHSDTETLLVAFEAWGWQATLERIVGMFAIALWDKRERYLFLARDRLGEKPLYCGWQGKVFLFGSELKALKAHPAFVGKVNREAISLFLRYTYVPAPYSIYEGIEKLEPGSWRCVSEGGEISGGHYWSLFDVAEKSESTLFSGSEEDAINILERKLSEAVVSQCIADVPLGAFLSGGVDSSVVVALMQAQSSRPIKTFTIGFHEFGYNEAQYAKAVASHLRTEHTELYVSPQDAMNVIPRLPVLYDEPFSDSSQIPTFLVSQLARQHVTVALSGDAGDELFGGYNRYYWARGIWKNIRILPLPLRKILARGLRSFPPEQWDRLYWLIAPVLPKRLKVTLPGDKFHKLAGTLASSGPETIYHGLVSHWTEPGSVVIEGKEPLTVFTDRARWPRLSSFERWMMAMDTVTYLPDDILVKVDRAAMGVSLESRVPMLDHRVVEFAWSLPLKFKIRDGQGKWLLRQLLYRHVPRKLIERPKMGFGVPIDSWLRGPLRDWAEDLLGEERLRLDGYLHPDPIRKKWKEHLSGQQNWQYYLWDVLMFQAWLAEQ